MQNSLQLHGPVDWTGYRRDALTGLHYAGAILMAPVLSCSLAVAKPQPKPPTAFLGAESLETASAFAFAAHSYCEAPVIHLDWAHWQHGACQLAITRITSPRAPKTCSEQH